MTKSKDSLPLIIYIDMRKIKILSKEIEPKYKDDCERVIEIFSDNDIDISIYEADDLWSRYSEDHAAGWIMMDRMSDKEIFKGLKEYYELI